MSMSDTDIGKRDNHLVYLQALKLCDSMNMGVGDSQHVNARLAVQEPLPPSQGRALASAGM